MALQDDYECIYSVVDLHALTTGYENPEEIRRNTREMVADWLAVGVDPQRSIVFRQGDVHEHAELATLLGMVTPLSWLERVPTYKGQIAELGEAIDTFGFLGYPLLQTADIILYRATRVPVGQDQLPHLELAREVVRRMNHLYGELFPEPQADARGVPAGARGGQPEDEQELRQRRDPRQHRRRDPKLVMSMITDPQRTRRDIPGRPEICTVFAWHKAFGAPQDEIDAIYEGCTTAVLGCVDDKRALAERVKARIGPIRERREALMADPTAIDDILADGADRARAIAAPILDEVKAAMGLR